MKTSWGVSLEETLIPGNLYSIILEGRFKDGGTDERRIELTAEQILKLRSLLENADLLK